MIAGCPGSTKLCGDFDLVWRRAAGFFCLSLAGLVGGCSGGSSGSAPPTVPTAPTANPAVTISGAVRRGWERRCSCRLQ